MLIHQFWSWFMGKHEEFKDEMKLQEQLIKTMKQFYAKNSKLTFKQVEEFLKHDSWFSAGECIEAGLVDEII